MDRRDLDLRDRACRHCPRAWRPPRPAALRPLLVAGLAALWSLRLGSHIVLRTARGGDDPRYRQLRVEWGDKASGRLFWFLQVQAAAGSRSRIVDRRSRSSARNRTGPLRRIGRRGLCGCRLRRGSGGSATGAASGETPRISPRSAMQGLWAYSRHPNYFFEWLVWVSFAIIAIGPAADYPWGWFGLAAPAS